jgi:hypothetical protein
VLHVPESSKATRFYHAYSQTLETQAALFTEMLIPFVQKHKKYQRDYAGGMTLQERTEMDAYSESTEPRDEHQEVLNRTYQHYKQCFPRQDKLAQLWHAFCRAYAEHNPEEANLPDYVAHWVQEQMLTRSDTESLRQFIEDIPPAWWQHQISTALPPQNIAKYWAKLKIPKTQRRSNIPSETTHAAIPGWLNPETQAAIPMFSEHTHTLRKIQKAAMGRYMPPNYRRQHGEDNKLLPIGAMAEDFARFSPHLQALTQQMLNTSTARIQYASATSQNQFYDVLRTKTAQYRYVKSMHDRLAQSMQGLSTW